MVVLWRYGPASPSIKNVPLLEAMSLQRIMGTGFCNHCPISISTIWTEFENSKNRKFIGTILRWHKLVPLMDVGLPDIFSNNVRLPCRYQSRGYRTVQRHHVSPFSALLLQLWDLGGIQLLGSGDQNQRVHRRIWSCSLAVGALKHHSSVLSLISASEMWTHVPLTRPWCCVIS